MSKRIQIAKSESNGFVIKEIALPSDEKAVHLNAVHEIGKVVALLRKVRDEKLYRPEYDSFRALCVKNFGSGIGEWLDDNLY